MTNPSLTYRDAGVNIDAGNELVKRIRHITEKTQRPEVLSNLGGFSALCEIPLTRYRQPVMVSATDGVGTKLKLAMQLNIHDTIGIDLVAMCVNDLIVCGAEPIQFLDYYATGKLSVDIAAQVISGIGEGCLQAGAALVGGETAEMPGMYADDDYDLAGFCVGLVEKSRIIDGSKVRVGDELIAIASSGLHSNGFSLVRKIIADHHLDLTEIINGQPLGEALLTPTKIYVKSILPLLTAVDIHAMAHITGGGFTENIPRVLPDGCQAVIDRHSWTLPPLFQHLQAIAQLEDHEMWRTFNCGVGMVLCISAEQSDIVLEHLHTSGEIAWKLGHVAKGDGKPSVAFA